MISRPETPSFDGSGGSVDPARVREQLDRVLASPAFATANNARRFLEYVVGEALADRAGEIKEYPVGVAVFRRGEDFDPRADAVVRIEATRLRRRLREYYEHEGRNDSVLIDLPKGSYVPVFRWQEPPAAARDIAEPRIAVNVRTRTSTEEKAIPSRVLGGRIRMTAPVLAAIGSLLLGAGAVAWFLERSDYFWQNPLANARFTRLTDFDGVEQDAVISRDGKFVAFLSDRDGSMDVWITQVGTGEFHNLSKDRSPEPGVNPAIRTIGFTPDGSLVSFWVRDSGSSPNPIAIGRWAVPIMGGPPRPYMEGVAELEWSPDGKRMVYHTPAAGDPLFVTEPNARLGHQIFVAPPGVHNHFPVWSPDGEFIYFVHGLPPDKMDIWRIRPTGDNPERITFHSSRVAYPVLLDERTLLYLATAEDGSGPWLYGMNLARRVAHRISMGVQQYTSIAATGDGRRMVATLANPKTSLWRVPISDRMAEESDSTRIALPTVGGLSPRLGPGYLLYLSPRDGTTGIRKLADGVATELWSGQEGRVVAGPAIGPDGRHIVVPVRQGGRTRLYLMSADGTDVHPLAERLDARGAPAWSPDGRWIAVAADQGRGVQLFRIPLDGGEPVPIIEGYAIDPAWSPDGRFLVYSGRDVGTIFPVKATTADGKPYDMPDLVLTRGGRRLCFLAGRPALIVLKGEIRHKNFWLLDLQSGSRRQLTNFGHGLIIGDFDVSPDGGEIVFDRMQEESDIVIIDLPHQSRRSIW